MTSTRRRLRARSYQLTARSLASQRDTPDLLGVTLDPNRRRDTGGSPLQHHVTADTEDNARSTAARSRGSSGPGVPAPSLASWRWASTPHHHRRSWSPRETPGSAPPYRLSPPLRSTSGFLRRRRRLNWRRS